MNFFIELRQFKRAHVQTDMQTLRTIGNALRELSQFDRIAWDIRDDFSA
jgi:hypothetical protein